MPPGSSVVHALTVIIPVTSTAEEAAGVAATLLAQADYSLQILIASDRIGGLLPSAVQWVVCPRGTSLPRLIGAALSEARADTVAILDGSCRIWDGWPAAALAALKEDHPVVGGAVEPEGLVTATDWAAYFTDYGRFMKPLPAGQAAELPGCNIAFRRSALQHGREFAGEEFWKSHWCRVLQAEGFRLQAAPDMVITYRRRVRLSAYLAHRFEGGRSFAGLRRKRMTFWKTAAYFAGSPALVPLLLFRTLEQILARRRFRRELARALPIMILAMIAWTAGEISGYVAGPGSAHSKHELGESRFRTAHRDPDRTAV